MGLNTLIEWTHFPGFQGATWNPWQGCHKVSQGCKNCYMFRDKKRYGQDPDTVVRSKSNTFNLPLRIQTPTVFFVCSWSDFYIEEADQWRDDAWRIIQQTPQHRYLILTKRPERIQTDVYLSNVALGVTAENQEMADTRLPILLRIDARFHFVSLEPLLEYVDLKFFLTGMPEPRGGGVHYVTREMAMDAGDLSMEGMPDYEEPRWEQTSHPLDWVITGGESGPGFRCLDPIWIEKIAKDCKDADVPLFHKQNGGTVKVNGIWGGNEVLGDKYQEFPEWEL